MIITPVHWMVQWFQSPVSILGLHVVGTLIRFRPNCYQMQYLCGKRTHSDRQLESEHLPTHSHTHWLSSFMLPAVYRSLMLLQWMLLWHRSFSLSTFNLTLNQCPYFKGSALIYCFCKQSQTVVKASVTGTSGSSSDSTGNGGQELVDTWPFDKKCRLQKCSKD